MTPPWMLVATASCAIVTGCSLAMAAGYARIARRRGAQLERAAVIRRAETDLVRRLADASHHGVAQTHRCIVDAVREAIPHAQGVLVFAVEDAMLRCVASGGEPAKYFKGTCIALDDPSALPAAARAAGHRVVMSGALRATYGAAAHAAAAPLSIDAPLGGALEVFGARRFSSDDLGWLASVAEFGALAWRVAADRERDRRRAERDALTGLLTPAELRRRLSHLAQRASASRTARFALLFVDTDRFKEWNDARGHAAGDALLREIGALLRGFVIDPDDLVARNGGDEFCVVFCDTDKADAIVRAERLRAAFATLSIGTAQRPDDRAPCITASIGVAAFPHDGCGAAELLERADAAMYFSKRAGRDAVAYRDPDGTLVAIRGGESIARGTWPAAVSAPSP